VEVTPCNDFFERIDDEKIYLSNPDEQLGNSLHFTFKMGSIDLPSKYKVCISNISILHLLTVTSTYILISGS
jgi:hypothetical protein